jgi:hypothetical protein
VSEGRQARAEGQPITANPYLQTCHQSLREHWLWHHGWLSGHTGVVKRAAKTPVPRGVAGAWDQASTSLAHIPKV